MPFGFDHSHYVPTLKWKQGEYRALSTLSPDVKDGITPLIEICDVPWDFENDQPRKTLVEHLDPITDQIGGSWGGQPAFIDTGLIESEDALPGGVSPLGYLLAQAQRTGLILIPVISISVGISELQALCRFGQEVGTCLRLNLDEFTADEIAEQINAVLAAIDLRPKSVDIVLDLEAINPSQIRQLRAVLRTAIDEIPYRDEWRTMSLTATAFPIDLTEVTPGVGSIARAEYALWRSLISGRMPQRLPAFGDYTVTHSEMREDDPRYMFPSASIRYTSTENWLVFRGHVVRGPHSRRHGGHGQFHALSAQVVAHAEFCGAQFSWGDDYIVRCATHQAGPGSMSTWRQVGVSHHITFAQRQISNQLARAAEF